MEVRGKNLSNQQTTRGFLLLVGIGYFLLFSTLSVAELEDTAKYESAARKAFSERFLKFTQDKNVMGRASTPDGSKRGGGRKKDFNRDDGIAFQSDLTYHDSAFDDEEEITSGGSKKMRALEPFVSEHGAHTAGAGSSNLERTVYGFHDKYAKEEEARIAAGKPPAKTQPGVDYEGVFKVTTREILPPKSSNPPPPGPNGQPTPPQKVPIYKSEMRDEVSKAVEKVGEDSFETVKRAGRDPGKEDDATEMPNMTFLYEAASRATSALWNSTLANLSQRRINKLVNPRIIGGGPAKLNLSVASCEDYANKLQERIADQVKRNPGDQALLKQLNEDYKVANQNCKSLARMPYNVINPDIVDDPNDPTNTKAKLATGDLTGENGYERDLRNQLEVMTKGGKSVGSLQSNWKYDPKIEKTKLQTFDEGGTVTGVEGRTVREQINSYNSQLEDAISGFEDVKARIPNLNVDTDAIRGYEIQPETQSVMEINTPRPSVMDEFDKPGDGPAPAPKNYEQLLQKAAAE